MCVKNFIKNLINFVYPEKCYLCDKIIIQNNTYLCENCTKNLNINTQIRTININNTNNIFCVSPFEYSGDIKQAIWRFKFRNCKYYSKFFSEIISQELIKNLNNINFNYICSVPVTNTKYKTRGFNQAECLARDLSQKLNINFLNILQKVKNTQDQHELNLNMRKTNILGAFKINDKINSIIKNKNILLCDDIITTGNTLSECAKILLESGVSNITCCTIAYSKNYNYNKNTDYNNINRY